MVHVKKQKLIQDKGSREFVRWYDKNGKRIYDYSLIEKWLVDSEYKVVKQERLWWGGFLSTVWLGLDHSFGLEKNRKPLIFETMLFYNGDSSTYYRYSTLKEAQAGHLKAKEELTAREVLRVVLNSIKYKLYWKKIAIKYYIRNLYEKTQARSQSK